MKLVKNVKTDYSDYIYIRNLLKKGYTRDSIIIPLCRRSAVKMKDARQKLENLVEWGQVEKIEVDNNVGVTNNVVKSYKYVLKENPVSLNASLGIDQFGGWQSENSMKGRIKFDKLLSLLSKFYAQPKKEILSTCRRRELVVPRQMFCYITKFNMPNVTLKEIGKYLGNRDHSTIIHGIRTAGDLIETDKQFRKEYEKLEEFIISNL